MTLVREGVTVSISEQELLNQLIYFYYHLDLFQEHKLPQHEIRKTLTVLLHKGRILTDLDTSGLLLGYVESWRITEVQLSNILLKRPFDVGLEDISTGPYCYVANTTIRPGNRFSEVYRRLHRAFLAQNADATHFCGEANRKRPGLVKMFEVARLSRRHGGGNETAQSKW